MTPFNPAYRLCANVGGELQDPDRVKYVCSMWRNRGEAICPSDIKVGRTLWRSLPFKAIKEDWFTAEGLAVFTGEVH